VSSPNHMNFFAMTCVFWVAHASRVFPNHPLEVVPIFGIVCGDLETAVENLETESPRFVLCYNELHILINLSIYNISYKSPCVKLIRRFSSLLKHCRSGTYINKWKKLQKKSIKLSLFLIRKSLPVKDLGAGPCGPLATR
jgi:hypothetical protein